MRKAIRATVLLSAALFVAAVGVAAGAPSGSGGPDRPPVDPGHQPFVISGNLSGTLAPGRPPSPLDLTLSNPNNQQLSVTMLTVTVVGTSAGSGCDASNFGVAQYRGSYPLSLGARQTTSLTRLGVATAALPTVRMIDLSSNQDNCKQVTVYLSYAGTGAGR
jgi:hypothetical protein